MSLQALKKKLNIDQQNVIVCTVVRDFDTYMNVRTPDGKVVRAGKSAGATFDRNSQVEVRTDKRSYSVIGTTNYAEYAAEKGVAL